MTKSPGTPGFIVAGPDFSTISCGVPGGNVNCPTRPEVLVVPPSLVTNSDTGLPSTRKFSDNV
jgi:hypothetical protein